LEEVSWAADNAFSAVVDWNILWMSVKSMLALFFSIYWGLNPLPTSPFVFA
jgi:hypothetical protein